MLLEKARTNEDIAFSLDNVSVWPTIKKERDVYVDNGGGEGYTEICRNQQEKGRLTLERNRENLCR